VTENQINTTQRGAPPVWLKHVAALVVVAFSMAIGWMMHGAPASSKPLSNGAPVLGIRAPTMDERDRGDRALSAKDRAPDPTDVDSEERMGLSGPSDDPDIGNREAGLPRHRAPGWTSVLPPEPAAWLRELAAVHQVRLSSVSADLSSIPFPTPAGRQDPLWEVNLKISGTTEMAHLLRFLEALDYAPCLIHIPEMDLSYQEDRRTVSVQLRLTLLGGEGSPNHKPSVFKGRTWLNRQVDGSGESSQGPLTLNVGERHILLRSKVQQVLVSPIDSVDVSMLGNQTLILTPCVPGSSSLRLVVGDREEMIPLRILPRRNAPPPSLRTGSPLIAPEHPEEELGDEQSSLPIRTPQRTGSCAESQMGGIILRREANGEAGRSSFPDTDSRHRVPKLSGILKTPRGPVAILDGRPVSPGEQCGEWTMEWVSNRSVVVGNSRGKMTLELPDQDGDENELELPRAK